MNDEYDEEKGWDHEMQDVDVCKKWFIINLYVKILIIIFS